MVSGLVTVTPGRRRRLGRLSASMLLAAACSEPELTPHAEQVARIGGALVDYEQFERFVEEVTGDPGTDLESEVLSALLDQFLLEEQLRRLAVDRRLVAPGDSRRAALSALLGSGEPVSVTESEVAAYYREHATEFARPERVRLRQILVEDRAVAEQARAELGAGGPFEAVAGRLSIDPSAALGGDQGELTRLDLPAALADAIFALEAGEISEILEAAYGYHIFQVVERLPAEQLPLDEASREVRRILATRAADARRAELAAEARERYNLEIEARNLPFRYVGGETDEDQPE